MILRKLLMLVFLAVAVCVMSAGVGAAAVITVDDSGGADFTSIQAAVDVASEGDTIEVRSGTYVENVDVNKQLILRGIDTGTGMPEVNGSGTGSTITLSAGNSTLDGFSAVNSTGWQTGGIKLSSNDNTIRNNIASNNNIGIYLVNSDNNILTNNIAIYNVDCGICIDASYTRVFGNTIKGNYVNNNNYGIKLQEIGTSDSELQYNTLNDNKISNNNYGLALYFAGSASYPIGVGSSNNVLFNNIMTNNRYNFYISGEVLSDFIQDINISNTVDGKPIYYLLNEHDRILDASNNSGFVGIINSSNILIKDLTLTNNGQGILLINSNNSKVENVKLLKNDQGIIIRGSHNFINNSIIGFNEKGIGLSSYGSIQNINNTISNSLILNNSVGISLYWSISGNRLYHNNFINNSVSVDYSPILNFWDNGYPSGGNYWSDYIGTDSYSGPNQNQLGNDSIGDTPYLIPGGSVDNYPLMNPWGSAPISGPVHNINKGTDYTSIQAAIHDASTGDEIHVDSGTYYENVVVNKQLILRGIDTGTGIPIVNAGDTEFSIGILIDSNDVTIEGFEIVNSDLAGIFGHGDNIQIVNNNIISHHYWGIILHSNNSILDKNNITNPDWDGTEANETGGIWVAEGSFYNITNNNISNGLWGISEGSLSFGFGGIEPILDGNLYILNNNIVNTNIGIFLGSDHNIVKYNYINTRFSIYYELTGTGIALCTSNSTIRENYIENNERQGILLIDSDNNTFFENEIIDNGIGINLTGLSNDNRLYHNNFNNTINTVDEGPQLINEWDDSYPSGGNYWSDYYGDDLKSGPNQDQSGSDGIGDTPYPISGGSSIDRYPLIEPWGTIPITSITITYPSGGEEWQAGTTQTIQWSYTGNPYGVEIEIFNSSGSVQTFTYVSIGSDGSGSYQWFIPENLASGTDYQVKITIIGSAISDTSGYFTINATSSPPPSDYEGKLLRQTGDFKIYLIENDNKRHFTSPEALEWNGYSFNSVIEVSVDVINSFEPGADISITQAIIDKYNALGGSAATFGTPAGTGEQIGYPDNAGVICNYVNFQNGAIEYFTNGDQAGNAYAILNPFFDKWAYMEYAKSVLGYPISDMSDTQNSSLGTPFKYQNFINGTERGALEYNISSGEVFEIHGAIYATWSAMGYADSILGLVTSDERDAVPSFKGTTGRVSDFENGHLHWHSSGDHYMVTYMTYGDLDELYVSMGGTASWLGFPVMHQEDRDGYGYCEFEGGYIEWDGIEYKAIPITGPVHNINKGTDYTTIQAAIDDASPGDEIHVDSGTYYENVVVNKQLILRGIDTGAGMPVVDAGGSGSAIILNADETIIDGFKAINSSNIVEEAGIKIISNGNTLIDNNASNNSNGILLTHSINNILRGNNVSNNFISGFYLWDTRNNILNGNKAYSDSNNGIYIAFSSNNTINNNYISNNYNGIFIYKSNNITLSSNNACNNVFAIYLMQNNSYNSIVGNNVSHNYGGIYLDHYSNNNILINNNADFNEANGIRLYNYCKNNILTNNIVSNNNFGILLQSSSNNNMLSGNIALNNYYGIWLHFSSNNNTLVGNNASYNYGGIYLEDSNNNYIYHNNILFNANQAYDNTFTNFWDNSYPLGGNYWNDYLGNDNYEGPNQDQPGSDGMGDTPYPIPGGSSVDRYPLINPWTAPPLSGKIAFASSCNRNQEVYVMNANGSGDPINLTNRPDADDGDPTWSPDGTQIAFSSNRSGNWTTYIMNADGSDQVCLLEDVYDAWGPAWSPDGTKIAVACMNDSSADFEIFTVDVQSQALTQVTDNTSTDCHPSWSPDSHKIVFTSDRDNNQEIYVADLLTGIKTRLTENLSNDDYPEWSPDGNMIAFVSERDGNLEIYSMDIASKAITRLTYSDSIDKHAQWSPDGQNIVFISDRDDGDMDVYVMKADGTGITCLLDWDGEETHPTWSSGHSSPPAYSVGEGAPTPEIKQLFIDAYNRNGGVDVLGDPTTEVHDAWGYWVQDFPGVLGIPGGVLMYNSIQNNASYIHGAIWEKYYNYPNKADLGPVKCDEKDAAPSQQGTTGRYSKFETGTIHWISDENVDHPQKGQSFVTYGDLDALYTSMGGTYNNWLGFPVMDQIEKDGHEYCEFEGGYIEWDGSEYNAFFLIQGLIEYFDGVKENSDGTIGGYLPLEYAIVEIDNDTNLNNGILGMISTDNNGNFEMNIHYNEEFEIIYFRIYTDSYIVKVEDTTNGRNFFETSFLNDPLQIDDLYISINDANVNPIFNVYSNIQKSFDTFSNGMNLPKVIVYLRNGDGMYDPIQRYIYINKQNYINWLYLGYNSEVYHEYGHFVHLNKYFKPINYYPPNTDAPDYSKDTPNEISGWCEGWAFFSTSVVYDRSFYFLEKIEYPLFGWYEVYTGLEDGHYQKCKGSICLPTDFDNFNKNCNNLGRVASFLWDIYDGISTEEPYDKIDGNNNIVFILDVLNLDKEYTLTYYNYSTGKGEEYKHRTPLTVKEFFNGYIDLYKPQKNELIELVKYHFSENDGYVHIIANSPVDLHLYNSLNQHIGFDESKSIIEQEITGSYYTGPDSHPEEIFLIRGYGDENIEFIIKGTGEGTFTLTLESAANGKISSTVYEDINVNSDSIGYITDNIYSANYILRMDYDGNGIVDQIILPTSIIISGENLYNITFLPPITTMDQFNLTYGSTLPIKFTARNNSTDEFIHDPTVNVTITNSTGHLITYFTNGTGTDSVRINSTEEQYIANFHTKDYAINIGETYSVTVTFGEPDSLRGYDITYFTLIEGGKAKGKGN